MVYGHLLPDVHVACIGDTNTMTPDKQARIGLALGLISIVVLGCVVVCAVCIGTGWLAQGITEFMGTVPR